MSPQYFKASRTIAASLGAAALLTTTALAQGMSGDVPATIETSAGTVTMEEVTPLTHPWGMEYLPNGDLLITEKVGDLRRLSADGTLSDPIAGVPEVVFLDQGGLLDVAVDPNFERNRRIYLYYVEAAEEQPDMETLEADPRLGPYVNTDDTILKGGAVLRATLRGDRLRNAEVIWRQTPKTIGMGHFGGRLLFADDGTLIVTSGERQRFEPSQDMDQSLGKAIRINTDGSIPDDNPYSGEDAPTNEIWASGIRNPLGIAHRPGTDEIWYHEMGPLHGDEFSMLRMGVNYGWPTVSNGENYDRSPLPHHETQPDAFQRPDYYWRPAISPSGLAFYEGEMFADWEGDALIGGLSSQALIRLELEGENVTAEERLPVNMRVRDVMIGNDGSIMILRDGEDGALLRLTPAE